MQMFGHQVSKFLSASRHSVENPDNLEVKEAKEYNKFYSLSLRGLIFASYYFPRFGAQSTVRNASMETPGEPIYVFFKVYIFRDMIFRMIQVTIIKCLYKVTFSGI